MNEIIVVDYDPKWPHLFETLRGRIWSAVADIAISIEHVGSTSVPGLAAKPVIDMDVVVAERDVALGIARLTSLGYCHRGDLGVPQREAFHARPGSPPHHLYLCPSTSSALANHLAVRNHLRANPSVAQAYGGLKKRLAVDFAHDIEGYVDGKTSFLLGILSETGFSEIELARIERINRRPTAS